MLTKDIQIIESEIDNAFADNGLAAIPWTQSAWTMLSMAEDQHFKAAVIAPLPDREAAIFVDGLLNDLTHPLRALYKVAPKTPTCLNRSYIETHYSMALQWLDSASGYQHFCSIFPLFYSGEIDIQVVGDTLFPTDWSLTDLSYEVYDRFVAKRDPKKEQRIDSTPVIDAISACTYPSGKGYSVAFNHRLIDQLHIYLGPEFLGRHVLPADWQFHAFSISQYRQILVCLQVMSEAWFIARQLIAESGVLGLAYQSSVWTPERASLVATLAGYTGVPEAVVGQILNYLTFGEVGIRNPDIAIQPLVDLGNGRLAISPFVLTQIHAERNLCVLLNQVSADRLLYAKLVNEKEGQLRRETIDTLSPLGFDCRYGRLGQTDVDLAIIDHKSKSCICIELKWFIEPAEIREVISRSKELEKGILQANLLRGLFEAGDPQLLKLLKIDQSYDFLAVVGSVNFIGRPGIQDSRVPIIKLWHLISKIKDTASLSATQTWLRSRCYLPVKDCDYKVEKVPIKCGRWKSHWYGIRYANIDCANQKHMYY
jgi:hypothetical protein